MNLHNTVLDLEHQIFALVGDGAPTGTAANANVGTEYTDRTTGDFWKMRSDTGWTKLSASGSSTVDWTTGVTGKPTTLSGYGITDALHLSGGTLTGLVTHTMGTATSNIRATYVSGDTYARWYQNADGSMWWGSGSAAADVSLYRIGANTLGSNGVLRSTSTSGWAIGELPGVPRIRYGAQGANSFDMISSGDGFADLYVANITASSLAVAQNHSVYWPVGGGGWYMSDTTFMRVYGNKMIYASGGILLDPGNGLQSNASGSATLSFVSGAPGYLDFKSGDPTVAGLRVYRNGSIAGYVYAANYSSTESYFGLLNNAGNWMLQLNPNSIGGGTLFSTWTHAARAIFNEYAQFSYGSGFISGYIGSAQTAGALINGSAQGDLCIRSENKRILFSIDAGNTIIASIDASGIHAHDFILT